MTFDNVRQDAQLVLSPVEMLMISQEISLKYSPIATTMLVSDEPAISAVSLVQPTSVEPTNIVIPNYDLPISTQELQDISNSVAQNYSPTLSQAVAELILLPVDPYHVYAYWTLPESYAINSTALLLRLYWRPDVHTKRSSVWFDFTIDALDAHQHLILPIDGSTYSAAIGYQDSDHRFNALVTSNVVSVPVAARRIQLNNQSQMPVTPDTNELSWSEKASNQPLLSDGWFIKLHTVQAVGAHVFQNIEFINQLHTNGISVELIQEPEVIKYKTMWLTNVSGIGM